jgi:hypothetical protein
LLGCRVCDFDLCQICSTSLQGQAATSNPLPATPVILTPQNSLSSVTDLVEEVVTQAQEQPQPVQAFAEDAQNYVPLEHKEAIPAEVLALAQAEYGAEAVPGFIGVAPIAQSVFSALSSAITQTVAAVSPALQATGPVAATPEASAQEAPAQDVPVAHPIAQAQQAQVPVSPASESPEVKEAKFAEQLEVLRNMGFEETSLNIYLLELKKGNVSNVVDWYLSNSQM